MYSAPLVILALGAIRLWRTITLRLEKQGLVVPRVFQYYTGMYVFLGGLMVKSFFTMNNVLAPSGWLDPETTREVAGQAGGTFNEEEWAKEASLSPFLKYFSLSMPIFLILTFLVCSIHTVMQASKCEGGLIAHPQRDETMTVLALPAVYCLMAFKGGIHMWQTIVNYSMGVNGNSGWEDRKEFYAEMWDSNFMVADVYECIALLIFARLTLDVIRQQVSGQASTQEASDVSETNTQLMNTMASQTVSGVTYFCVSCALQAAYTLTVTTLQYLNMPIEALSTPEIKEKAHYFFLGMGTIASAVAIQNIITVEHTFGHKFLSMFNPSRKFWSAKVLVSLAFMQTCLLMLPPFSSWSQTCQNLFYSAAICCECFFISLFHLMAWNSNEKWYKDLEGSEQTKLQETLAART